MYISILQFTRQTLPHSQPSLPPIVCNVPNIVISTRETSIYSNAWHSSMVDSLPEPCDEQTIPPLVINM